MVGYPWTSDLGTYATLPDIRPGGVSPTPDIIFGDLPHSSRLQTGRPIPLLVTSDGDHWRPGQTCSVVDLPLGMTSGGGNWSWSLYSFQQVWKLPHRCNLKVLLINWFENRLVKFITDHISKFYDSISLCWITFWTFGHFSVVMLSTSVRLVSFDCNYNWRYFFVWWLVCMLLECSLVFLCIYPQSDDQWMYFKIVLVRIIANLKIRQQ